MKLGTRTNGRSEIETANAMVSPWHVSSQETQHKPVYYSDTGKYPSALQEDGDPLREE